MEQLIPIINSCTITGDRNTGFYMDRFEDYLKKHKKLVFPHRHQFYHLVLFIKGKGSFTIDFDRFDARDWRAYFMAPGQIHTWDLSSLTTGFVINVESSFFESFLFKSDYLDQLSLFKGFSDEGIIDIPLENQAVFLSNFEELFLLFRADKVLNKDLLRSYLLLILNKLVKLHVSRSETIKSKIYPFNILQKFQDLIEKNFRLYHLPNQYAELLSISSNHLNTLCKAHIGKQAGEMIRNRVILEAKRLMAVSGLNISEIADDLNFKDNSYFTKFFKKHTQLTPEEFRLKIKNSKLR